MKLIDNYIKQNNLSKTKFCKLCGISYYILKQMYLGNMHINIEVWIKIVEKLNINMVDFIKRIDT